MSLTRHLVVATLVFAVSLGIFLRAAETAPFHGDESEWINSGRFFKWLFLDGVVSGETWRPSFLTRDQPPLGRYFIGFIVWLSGNNPGEVNRSYAWSKDFATNEREGRVPGTELRLPVRRAMALMGAVSVVGLYVVGAMLGSSVAGVVAAALVTTSPLVQLYFGQARTEALLAAVSVTALLAVLLAARRMGAGRPISAFGWSSGVWLGLALGVKLTAALAIVGTAAYGGLAILLARDRTRIRAFWWSATTMVLAVIIFVGTNPFLWPNPIVRTWSMLDQQRWIMEEQSVQFGGGTTVGFPARVGLVVWRTFVQTSTPSFDEGLPAGGEPVLRPTLWGPGGLPLGVVALGLAIVGTVALARRSVVEIQERSPAVVTAFLLWILAYVVGIAANLSLDWPRYYVPTLFFCSVLAGVGVSLTVATIARRLRLPTAAAGGRVAINR
jgi:4-amino-4-deoxy-L-arabinose transferase-like glycosyltransferase